MSTKSLGVKSSGRDSDGRLLHPLGSDIQGLGTASIAGQCQSEGRGGGSPHVVSLNVLPQAGLSLALVETLCADLSRVFPRDGDDLRKDFLVISQRYRAEGLTFLTKTMPKLSKALDAGVESGRLEVPREFKTHGKTKLPELLGCLFRRLFDDEGRVLSEPDPMAFKGLRQVLTNAYRLEFPYKAEDEAAVVQRFIQTERELREKPPVAYPPITAGAREVLGILLQGFEPRRVIPRHGPGSVATGESGDDKWSFARLYDRIDRFYPYQSYFMIGGGRELCDRSEWWDSLDRLETGTAKVTLVPKDSRGPRLISMEPLEYQYIQQGLGRALQAHLQRSSKGRLQFTDQSINAALALEASASREYATIDLQDASDRVGSRLVRELFPWGIQPYLWAARSSATTLPSGEIIELEKYAPMGSALCFPVESACFYALAVSAAETELGVNRQHAMQSIYVYGDDILVPTTWYNAVTSALESWRLVVNHGKSFWRGPFRESCGVDAFAGVDVTPVKPRTLWSGRREDGSALASWVSYANLYYKRGYTETAEFLRGVVERVHGPIPLGTTSAGYLCWEVPSYEDVLGNIDTKKFRVRWDADIQQFRIRARYLGVAKTPTSVDGWPRLLRNVTQGPGEEPDLAVARQAATLKWGWVVLT